MDAMMLPAFQPMDLSSAKGPFAFAPQAALGATESEATPSVFAALLEGNSFAQNQNVQNFADLFSGVQSIENAAAIPEAVDANAEDAVPDAQNLMDQMQKMFESLGLQWNPQQFQQQIPQIVELLQSQIQNPQSIDQLSSEFQELGFKPVDSNALLSADLTLDAGSATAETDPLLAGAKQAQSEDVSVPNVDLKSTNQSASLLNQSAEIEQGAQVLANQASLASKEGVQNQQNSALPQQMETLTASTLALKSNTLQNPAQVIDPVQLQKLAPLLTELGVQKMDPKTATLTNAQLSVENALPNPDMTAQLDSAQPKWSEKKIPLSNLVQPEEMEQKWKQGLEQDSVEFAEGEATSKEEKSLADELSQALAVEMQMPKEEGLKLGSSDMLKPIEGPLAAAPMSSENKVGPADYLDQKHRVEIPPPVHQVAKQLTLQVSAGVQSMRLMLNPENLGGIEVDVQLDGDRVQLHLSVDHEDAKKVLEKDLSHLRHTLESQNLKLEKVELSVNLDQQKSSGYGQASGDAREQAERGAKGQGGKFANDSKEQETVKNTEEQAPKQRYYGYNRVEYTA